MVSHSIPLPPPPSPPPPPPSASPSKINQKKLIIVLALVAIVIAAPIIVVLSLNANLNQSGFPSPTQTSTGPTPNLTNISGETTTTSYLKYKTAEFVDTQGIGTAAFSLLIPSDWDFQGNINWALDNPAMPATASIATWNPNGTEEFDIYPNQAYFWTDNPLVQQTNPLGSTYFGAVVKSPIGPIEALKSIILPMYRSDVTYLQIVSEKNLPDLDKLFNTGTDPNTGLSSSAESGKIRVEYTLNGVQMEEELYCVIQSLKIPTQSIYGTVTNNNWYLSNLASFRAEKGKLDQESKMFQTIAFSAKIDKNWLNKYNQLVVYLIQNQIKQIQSLGQLSQILSQTSDQISDENLKDWEQRQGVNDGLVQDFCNQILEIQPYNDPITGTTVDLPAGYTSVWTNSLGEYILGDSPSFNPNIGSNLNWQPMTTATG
jgi:hypothetical protein